MQTRIPLIFLRKNPEMVWQYLNYWFNRDSIPGEEKIDAGEAALAQNDKQTDIVNTDRDGVSSGHNLSPDQIVLLSLLLNYAKKA